MNTRTMILTAVGALALTACSNADDAKTGAATESGMEASATAPATDGAMAPTDGSMGSTTPMPDATGTTTEPTGDATAPGQSPPFLPTDPRDATSPPPQ